ncbi:MAG TPA: PhoU domain-containing protein, partial [Euzebya sp.]|nr:PhoU domain-containing protein [Euzebya sp.]
MRRTVKDLLSASKDTTELMLDLAFASVFLDEDKLAQEVLRLEERMDEAVRELRILCLVAARSQQDAQQLAGVLGMVNAMEEIADAAEDIARVTLRDLGVPPALRDDLRHADEVTARVKLREGSDMAGATLRDLALPTQTGMW